ncbi:MAG: peptidylprolyl isomerase [Candidatus Altimarinota bacterium]
MKKILMLLALGFLLVSCGKATTQTDPNIDLNNITGKRTFIGFVGTFCPHCQAEVPVLDKFYREYKDQVNMQLINTDGKKFIGDYIIPQDTSNPISYQQITGEKCDYVPSFVIFDENKNIINKVCGGKISHEELQAQLLIPNTNTETMDNKYQLEGFQEGDVGVIMTTTNGKIEIKLFPNDAPKTVNNFLALSKNGYYDNLTFHRVIKDFMIQGGDPEGTGMGGESIYGEAFEDEFSPKLKNIRGSLSMANSGANTNGSQFFINQKDNNFLDNKHSVFGQVVNGLDNVDKIASTKTDKDDKPEKEVKMIKVEVVQFQSGSLKPYDFSLEEAQKKLDAEKQAKAEANKNREVKAGDEIAVNYILTTVDDGKEYDNSYTRGTPLEFEVGAGKMIPGFDAGVIGMKVGEKRTLNLKSADAYGSRDDKNIQEVPKADLKDFEDNGFKLEVGVKLPTMYGEFEITEVNADTVKIDLNHPLAGKDLKFEVELVEFKN